MTTVTAPLDVKALAARPDERRRVARLIAAGSLGFTLGIAAVGLLLALLA